MGLVGGYIFSDNSADRGDYSDKSDNTNDAYVVVVNKRSVVLGCESDKIIILGSDSIFGNLIDLLIERGQINIVSDLLIDSVFNDSVGGSRLIPFFIALLLTVVIMLTNNTKYCQHNH